MEEFTSLVQSLRDKDLTEQQVKDEVTKYLSNKKGSVSEKNNPFAINLYVLGYNSDKNLTTLNR